MVAVASIVGVSSGLTALAQSRATAHFSTCFPQNKQQAIFVRVRPKKPRESGRFVIRFVGAGAISGREVEIRSLGSG